MSTPWAWSQRLFGAREIVSITAESGIEYLVATIAVGPLFKAERFESFLGSGGVWRSLTTRRRVSTTTELWLADSIAIARHNREHCFANVGGILGVTA